MNRSIDVFTLGETMIRLTPEGCGRLEESGELQVRTGGSESNVAVALTLLGLRCAWASRLPLNPLGRLAARRLAGLGLDLSHVKWVEEGRMGLYFIETGAPPRAGSILYDRRGSAASLLQPDDIDWNCLDSCRHLHLSGITPALGPGPAAAARRALGEARARGCSASFDVNYRARLWDLREAAGVLCEMVRGVDLLIATAEDAAALWGLQGELSHVARELRRETGAGWVALTGGAAGAVLQAAEGSFAALPYVVQSVDRVGAGDAFAAGAVWGLLNENPAEGCELGMAMAALKHTIPGDELIATREEIKEVRLRGSHDIRR